jgi:hypothetical protein
LRAFLVFDDGVEEVGDLNFPRMMFHIHLRKGRDDGLAKEVAIRTSPQPEVDFRQRRTLRHSNLLPSTTGI